MTVVGIAIPTMACYLSLHVPNMTTRHVLTVHDSSCEMRHASYLCLLLCLLLQVNLALYNNRAHVNSLLGEGSIDVAKAAAAYMRT
jgi:hypothetical protein